jgi:hypothetical protein
MDENEKTTMGCILLIAVSSVAFTLGVCLGFAISVVVL